MKITLRKTEDQDKKKVDPQLFKEIREHAIQVKSDNAVKNKDFLEYKKAFLLDSDELKREKLRNAKLTVSTDPRNKVLGAVRLMVGTDPSFNVKYTSKPEANDQIEKALTYIWNQAGRVANNPIHYDAMLSAILYGEMHIAIISTADLVTAAKAAKRGVERAERVASQTSHLLEAWSPEGGWFERDILGTCGYYRIAKVSKMKLMADFGALLPDHVKNGKDYSTYELETWLDTKHTCHWIGKDPIDLDEHGLPALPVCIQTVDGSNLFEKPEEQTQPLLYGVIKSGMWNRQNLAFTVMYTLIHGLGISPIWIHRSPTEQKIPLDLNFDKLGGTAELVAGEELAPLLNKGIIDPSLREGLAMATEKIEESTIPRQTLGEQLTGNNTYSALALLSQAGRLPLVGPQKRGGWGIATVAETLLAFIKHDAKVFNYGGIELKPSDIPDDIQIEAKLEVNLPQDQLQLANIANMLTEGDDPLMPHDWVRENILNIGQPKEMQKKIWNQKASTQRFMIYMKEMVDKMKAKEAETAMKKMPAKTEPGSKEVPLDKAPGTNAGPSTVGETTGGGLPGAMAGEVPGAGMAAALPPEAPEGV
jgi:hypothetical protein